VDDAIVVNQKDEILPRRPPIAWDGGLLFVPGDFCLSPSGKKTVANVECISTRNTCGLGRERRVDRLENAAASR